MGCLPPFLTQKFSCIPCYIPFLWKISPWNPPFLPLPLKTFHSLLSSLPSLWIIFTSVHSFLLSLWTLSHGIYQITYIYMCFISLPSPLYSWDQTGIVLSSSFFFLFGGNIFGIHCLAQHPSWGGSIYSAWRRDNYIAHPKMEVIMIYLVQSHSNFFTTKFRTKLRNMVGFDTVTSFECEWCVPNSNPICDK